MGWKELKDKFKQFNNLLDINTHFPNYINKTLFQICFMSFIIYVAIILVSTHGQMNWNYLECKSDKVCNSPFYLCNLTTLEDTTSEYKTPSVRMAIQQIRPDDRDPLGNNYCLERSLAPKWMVDFCDKYGCPKYMQPHQIIGDYPPRQIRDFPMMTMMLILTTIVVNHISYMLRKKDGNDREQA